MRNWKEFVEKKENCLRMILGLLSMVFLIHMGVSVLGRVQLDLTDEGLYTLSTGSINILKKMDSPLELKLYYSRTAANKGTEALRMFNNHFYYVRELLGEYVSYAGNNLNLDIIDPRPDTEDEEDAMAYGLKRFQITPSESYFFGLVARNESGTEKIIEFFDPNKKDRLEYEITKLIHTILKPKKKVVGVLSSMNILENEMAPYMARIMRMQGKQVPRSWMVVTLLRELYEVKKVDTEKTDLSGMETLIVIHPKGFTKKNLVALDQFLLKGGKILVLVDPNAVSDTQTSPMMRSLSSSPDAEFKNLMNNWGIEVMPQTFAGDKYLSGVGQTAPGYPPSRMIAIVNCNKKCTDHRDTISSGMETVSLIYPGALKEKKTEGVKISPIISTTDKGNTYTASPYEIGNHQALWNKFREGKSPVMMGLKAVGKFKTAFPKEKKKGHLSVSKKESAVVVFSDVDFISNRFAFRETFLGTVASGSNSSLFINAVEGLSGDVDLISVRSKERINRSFDVIERIEFEAEKRTAAKVRQINGSITRFQNELNQLGQQATSGNMALLQNKGLAKKKELARKVAKLKKELRNVKKEGREKIERIGKFFQYLNIFLVPLCLSIGGIIHFRRRKKWIARMSAKGMS